MYSDTVTTSVLFVLSLLQEKVFAPPLPTLTPDGQPIPKEPYIVGATGSCCALLDGEWLPFPLRSGFARLYDGMNRWISDTADAELGKEVISPPRPRPHMRTPRQFKVKALW